ncbi:hypothetical protein BH18GEM1_BH18GEM1_16050 [soil metagenome]
MEAELDFYQHEENWANRMILGNHYGDEVLKVYEVA